MIVKSLFLFHCLMWKELGFLLWTQGNQARGVKHLT